MCVTCGCSSGNTTIDGVSVPHAHPSHDPATHHVHTHADGTTHAHPHVHDHGHDHTHGHTHPAAHDHGHEHAHPHAHAHAHEHVHDHDHPHPTQVPGRDAQTIALEAAVLGKNQALAERNRGWLAGRGVLALNLMSSPGSGKTTLLERCIRDLQGTVPICVVEGDQATANDAQRIRAAGAAAVQVNTGTGCHLEADMFERALKVLQPATGSLVVVENVGNLVCPALFDLGETARVVIFSVTEGEDKPLKYPHMFRSADVLLLSKIDLLPHLRLDVERCIGMARRVNRTIEVIRISATTGVGMDAWLHWLDHRVGGHDHEHRHDHGHPHSH